MASCRKSKKKKRGVPLVQKGGLKVEGGGETGGVQVDEATFT